MDGFVIRDTSELDAIFITSLQDPSVYFVFRTDGTEITVKTYNHMISWCSKPITLHEKSAILSAIAKTKEDEHNKE